MWLSWAEFFTCLITWNILETIGMSIHSVSVQESNSSSSSVSPEIDDNFSLFPHFSLHNKHLFLPRWCLKSILHVHKKQDALLQVCSSCISMAAPLLLGFLETTQLIFISCLLKHSKLWFVSSEDAQNRNHIWGMLICAIIFRKVLIKKYARPDRCGYHSNQINPPSAHIWYFTILD